jgi:ABC-type transport system involved in multi-copper enzyme maturation permease subunit
MKALIVKDLQINRKTLLVPVWFVLALYLLSAVMVTVAISKGGENVVVGGVPIELLNNPDLSRIISFAVQVGLFLGILGFLFATSMIILGSTLLNSDVKHKCELFHRSQPVSVWEITASRFIAGIGGLVGVAFAIGLFQYLVGNLTLLIITPLKVDWWLSLNGFLAGWAHLSVSLLVLGSICFFLSSVFRDNAFGKGALILGAVELAIVIIDKTMNIHIPSPSVGLFKLIGSNIASFTEIFPTMNYGVQVGHAVNTGQNLDMFKVPPYFLYNVWSTILSWSVALKVAVSGALYLLATYIYKKREVQF